MPEFEIAIVHKVGEQFMKDLMCTMVESSYGWFAFKSVTRDDNQDILWFEVHEYDEDEPNGGVDFDNPDGWETITPLTIVATLREVVITRPFRSDLMDQITRSVGEDDADIDADAADCILQWALFGELTYS